MTTPKSCRAPLYLALLASGLPSCAWRARPPAGQHGPVAHLWRGSARGRDFERFTRQGLALSPEGELVLEPSASALEDPFPSHSLTGVDPLLAPGSYRLGRAVSEPQLIPGGFDSVVPSFEVLTPPGTWVRLTLAARVGGQWTKDYDFGVWTLEPGPVTRHSVPDSADTSGRVHTDTLVLGHEADALRMTVWLFSSRPEASPRVLALAAATADTRRTAVDEPSDGRAWGTVLEVPGRSQRLYPPDGGRWCSPTSLSMLLAYWGRGLGQDTLEVPVPGVAGSVFDATYQGTGNWPFNTAYAAALSRGALHGVVARFDSLSQVERLISARIPVSLSIAFGPGQLTGSPMEGTDGHLIVVKGFTPQGDVVCNDPAFPSDETVSVTYRREELRRAWEHSLRSAYVLWPTGMALPPGALPLVP